jgi:hypothetical protein
LGSTPILPHRGNDDVGYNNDIDTATFNRADLGRVSDYALVYTASTNVVFANLSFHATMMAANGDVSNLTFLSLEFNYSSVSRRALGETAPPLAMTVFRSVKDQPIRRQTDQAVDDVTAISSPAISSPAISSPAKKDTVPARFVFEDLVFRNVIILF